ncbi:Invasion protein B, involved in pathogenesis [Tritonibacter multivorans]|uniref:Invasion protein B, involved in pathogenesis n=1 Tax=Tritonibacter multivorans TaxID=928856 RepID=A0A0P1G9K3_9RHOB|nr:invasion associated locus B family protein [Tritonibacter multivorans]MDA7423015.1 invasion associated locus B family protein [Tritonibacter multivorans]CUH78165.1 Invasion protein B, involved in pathogenesis [Tritonibacter multivorans]SFD76904.1 Invasion protein IalB, involved in pathogenesis [Tritonibacter multivorans]
MISKNFFYAAFCVLVVAAPVSAQQKLENGTSFKDWRLACRATEGGAQFCTLIQQLTARDSGKFLAEVGLQPAEIEGKKGLVMALSTPTDMALTMNPGYRLSYETDVLPMQWRTCSATACLASRLLQPEEVSRLKRGHKILLGYQPAKATESTLFEVSLSGVTAGLAAIGR